MKKNLILFCIFLNSCVINNTTPYQSFHTFSEEHFEEYEKIRIEHNLTYLETINLFNYPLYFFPHSYHSNALFINQTLCLVNTNHYLSSSFSSPNLCNVINYNVKYIYRNDESIFLDCNALIALEKMMVDMEKQGLRVYLYSGYRSYEKQITIYNEAINKNEVAYPGCSEHQTGLAVDISTLDDGLSYYFSKSKEYQWLINNSYKYGFILRYPENKIDITGYVYEPWHYRYVGKDAKKIKNEITLEEYLFKNFELE
ncbi:MAG: M15 family metallopeptidase [Bacilli bacterium]